MCIYLLDLPKLPNKNVKKKEKLRRQLTVFKSHKLSALVFFSLLR